VLIDLRRTVWNGRDAERRLYGINITTTRYLVPGDRQGPSETPGLRLGTPAVTMRGFGTEENAETGRIIASALTGDSELFDLGARARALCVRHPLYPRCSAFAP